MNDSTLTMTIVVMTFLVAFVVAKIAPALQKEEQKCKPGPEPRWRLLGGAVSIRHKEKIEESYQGFVSPEGK